MKRRMFLQRSTIAAGAVGASGSVLPFITDMANLLRADGSASGSSPSPILPAEDIRSGEYLRRARATGCLPKPPAFAASLLEQPTRIVPMPLAERLKRGIVPQHGFCSTLPGKTVSDGLTAGNGSMYVEVIGDPFSEQVLFHHECLLLPWKRPFEAPAVANVLPQVRKLLLEGKYQDAVELAFKEMEKGPVKPNMWPHQTVPAFLMRLDGQRHSSVSNYLRTVDFECSEINVHWDDESGEWTRRTLTSRPDNVVAQLLTAPHGKSLSVNIALHQHEGMRMMRANPPSKVWQRCDRGVLTFMSLLDPTVDNSGYAGVCRVVPNGGSVQVKDGALWIENASSVLLLTRVEWFADFSDEKVEALRVAIDKLPADYAGLRERHRAVQSEAFNRVKVDFGGGSQHGMSSEELLADQRSREDYSPALLEKIFEMGRHWFIYASGKYPTMIAEVNANINLQLAPGPQGDLREGMNAYFDWMESLAEDFRVNARNIFGMRGTHYNLWPDKGMGVAFHYSTAASTGEMWPHPYWLSAGGWCCRPMWDHYLATGDVEFLRARVVPALKELALFYEDFLTIQDKNGNYIFVPSFSPENNPGNLTAANMLAINASMDIAVCREVLANLIEASETLGIEADNLPRWKAMIGKLPPYLLEPDGTLKEWAWPSFEERYSHRHISHLYGVWPGDEIDPDRTPLLAKAAMMADRRRVPERLAAHGRCHRALVGARLKDSFVVDTELRQLIEQGYVAATLRCSHDPYAWPMPDAQGGIPAIIMEMLLYSRPGVIEVLPALPPSLKKGTIRGMLARTFARIDRLTWNMEARTVDLTITAARKQNITLIARYGIQKVTATSGVLGDIVKAGSADCELHLPERKAVDVHLQLGVHSPLAWVNQGLL
jgi:alpha-L-fucosidase 2